MISKILLWSTFATCVALALAQLASNSVLEFGDEVDCSRIPPTLWCTCPKIAAKCDVTQACQNYAKASKNQPIHLTLLYESAFESYLRNCICKTFKVGLPRISSTTSGTLSSTA